jgi:prevent-host-death family protein
MRTIEMTKSEATLAEYIHSLTDEPLIITINGKPIAALISVKNMDIETAKLSVHPDFVAIIERSRTRYKKEGGISGKDMRRKFKIVE